MANKTFAVAGGAYKVGSLLSTLTHAAEIDANGSPVKVLCSRVRVENLLDDDCAIDPSSTPTCPICARKK